MNWVMSPLSDRPAGKFRLADPSVAPSTAACYAPHWAYGPSICWHLTESASTTRWFVMRCLPTTMCSGLAGIGSASAADSQVATNPLIPRATAIFLPALSTAGRFFRLLAFPGDEPGIPGFPALNPAT
jgi:hypothetical protein